MSKSPTRSRHGAAGARPSANASRSRPQADVLASVLGSSHPAPSSYAASSHFSSGRVPPPAGRVQATDYQPPPSPIVRPSSPDSASVQHHGSQASLSSLNSDDVYGSQDEDDDENGRQGPDLNASTFSVVAQMFDPNLYLHAQEAWSQWEDHKRADEDLDDEEQTAGTEDGYGTESVISRRTEEMSERAGLMSSSIAARRLYGTMPGGSVAGGSSQYGHHMAASSLRVPSATTHHEEPTMEDAMKTADIGGTPGSNLGILLLCVSQLAYSLMNGFVSLLDALEGEKAPGRGPDHPPISAFEIVFVECFIIWLGAIAAMAVFKTPYILFGPPKARLVLIARGTFGFLSTLFLYLSLENLSLSDATGIIFLGPLVTGVAAAVFLSEPFSVRERIAGIGSLLGVLLIARPTAIFGSQGDAEVPSAPGDTPPIEGGNESEAAGANRVFGVVIALAGVFCQSGAWIALRSLGRACSTYHSIAYFALCSWVLSLAGMVVSGQPFVWPSTVEATVVLFSVGLFSLLAQVFQTLGLQRETAARAAMVSYLQIIFATAFQCLVLGTPLELLSVVGSIMVLANGAWVAAAKRPGDAIAAH
ncbi:hypothetical protein BCV69DRAFT_280867 [Microstroma glucosiphilum]|uniref:EamA domain-containing protein n=1 Tax=Pseudomicrostroma glucosiphilum TaxID=1684307 RepID=A0A316UEB9_9BASI|nr:hypothetical protein BCV69DRAFT_280867 [Pseudomicrostroma glucosiphilum]PWN23258.1 hypothetical protein BCV69DRAFT_280867 [Pseudomicrostroma glucosiphilum]